MISGKQIQRSQEASNMRSLLWRIFQCPVKSATYVAQCEAKAEAER
jgi:hypothetical protein